MVCVGVIIIIIITIISAPMRVMSSYIISLFVRETATSRQIIIRPLIKLVYNRLFDEHFERVFEFLIAKAINQKITRTIQIDQHNRRMIADQLDFKCSNRVRIGRILVAAENKISQRLLEKKTRQIGHQQQAQYYNKRCG